MGRIIATPPARAPESDCKHCVRLSNIPGNGGQIESPAAQVRPAPDGGQDQARGLRALEPRSRQEKAAGTGQEEKEEEVSQAIAPASSAPKAWNSSPRWRPRSAM